MLAIAYPISEVPATDAGLLIIGGVIFVAIALFNQNFYWRKGISGGEPAPRWSGQLVFGGIGLLFIVIGAYNL